MGDLRNKLRKEREREAIERMQALLFPPRPPKPLPTCHACSKTWYDNGGSLYGVQQPDGTMKLHCDAHLPEDDRVIGGDRK